MEGNRTGHLLAKAGRVLAATLSLTALLGATAAHAGCQLQELAEINVEVQGSRIILPATINGKPARMLLDSGAFSTSLFMEAATRLGLKPAQLSAKSYGAGGAAQLWLTTAKTVSIGGLTARDMSMFVIERSGMDADGLLGAPFILQRDVEFDLPHGKIRFFQPKGCAGDQVVYWGQAYAVAPMSGDPTERIVVPVKVNGQEIRALMDTGASASVLTLPAAAAAGLRPGSPGVNELQASHGIGPHDVRTYVGVFSTFSFGDETIRNSRLQLADLFVANREVSFGSNVPRPAVDFPQMLLGADFFRSHRVYVAVSQRKVYVSYEGGPVFDTTAPLHRESTPDNAASGSDGGKKGASS
jgi:clan AA aspartic protease (TIGR02281 family)